MPWDKVEAMARKWRNAKVSMSSTFRDMYVGRDHLARVVVLELCARLAIAGHSMSYFCDSMSPNPVPDDVQRKVHRDNRTEKLAHAKRAIRAYCTELARGNEG